MEKEIKITAPEGYEIDKEKSSFECIKFKEIKKEYPISVEEISNRRYYIDSNGTIERSAIQYKDANQVSSYKKAEAFLALMQLIELRDAWNKIDGFVVDWDIKLQRKYTIGFFSNKIETSYYTSSVLYFGSEKTRDLFFNTFRELIEKIKELI